MKETFIKELNEMLNMVSRWGNVVEQMDEHPPKDKTDLVIAETILKAYEQAVDIMMKLERQGL